MNAHYRILFALGAGLACHPVSAVQLQTPELALSVIATDATRARQFYVEGLGLRDDGEAANPPAGLRMYLFDSGQATLKVRVYATNPPGRDPALLAENGLRFITIPVSDFDAALARLAARGYTAPTVRTVDGVRTGLAADGDGNVVEMIDAATAPTRKLEIGMITDSGNLAAAQGFYATTLGLPVAPAVAGPAPVPGATEYRYKANNTVLRLFAPAGRRATPTDGVAAIRGYRYITFTLAAGVDSLYDQMVAAGVPIASPLARYGATAEIFMARGPGGAIHEFVGPPRANRTGFTDMVMTADYFAPGQPAGSVMAETLEALALEPHQGRLYCATSYIGPAGTVAAANPKILVKDTAASPWRVDFQAGSQHARLPILRSVNFTTDGAGQALLPPVPVLVAGTGQWRSWFNPDDPRRYGVYVLTRDDASNQWVEHRLYHDPWNPPHLNHANETRMLFDHVDRVTGVHHVFAASQSGRVFRGWYDASAPGRVRWDPRPEIDNTTGLGLCAAEANGVQYLGLAYTPNGDNPPVLPRPATNFGLWKRIDGVRNRVDWLNPPASNPQWEWVPIPEWQNPRAPGESLFTGQLRGLTALADPKGGAHQVLGLHWDAPDAKLFIVDPLANHLATLELDTRQFFRTAWGNTAGATTVGYNDWLPATHPDTGEKVHLIGAWANYPGGELGSAEGKSSWFLVRRADASYSIGRIWDAANPLTNAPYGLRGCRSIRPSPFPNEAGRVWYFCGFDLTGTGGGRDVTGSRGWIYKGTLGSVPPPAAVGDQSSLRLSNVSVRSTLAAGQSLILGAVVSGGAKELLIRSAGPALNQFGLAGLADPRLELYTGGATPAAANEDWPAALGATFGAVGAFPFPAGSRDAALVQALNGPFTVVTRGTGAGAVLVETYNVRGDSAARLVNVSVRHQVGRGADILIAGFAVAGAGTKQLLIRAAGPALTQFGVAGVLTDPKLEVFGAAGARLGGNDNWPPALSATFARMGAFALPAASRDAALLIDLPAGATYTVQVSGADGGTGEALVEIYEVP